MVRKKVSTNFKVILYHETRKYLPRIVQKGLCFHSSTKKGYSSKGSYCQCSDIWEETLVLM